MHRRPLALLLPLLWLPGVAHADIYLVISGVSYPTIQAAIDAAPAPPDQEFVAIDSGTYQEVLDFKGKIITLVNAGFEPVVLEWDGIAPNDAVITSNGSYGSLTRITVRSSVNRAVWVDGGDFVVSGTTLATTLAPSAAVLDGGCVYNDGENFYALSAAFDGCSAPGDGGAIFQSNALANLTMEDTWVTGSSAGGDGGAIYGEDMTIERSTFCGNVSTGGNGGAIFGNTGFVTAEGSIFANNSASAGGAGGAIQLGMGGGSLINNDFLANTADIGAAVRSLNAAAAPTFLNNILAYQTGDAPVKSTGMPIAPKYSAYFSNEFEPAPSATNLIGVDPAFIRFSDDADCTNDLLHLQPGSPLIDAGDPAILDPDGTTSDIGAFGGTAALADWFVDDDLDGDLFVYECDDTRADSYFGAPELCNDLDEDCDLVADNDPVDPTSWYDDADFDAFGDPATGQLACDAPPGTVTDATDCDDSADDRYPGAPEFCTFADENCDGDPFTGAVDETAFYPDDDTDGFGDAAAIADFSCVVPPGEVTDNTDCDDAESAANPDELEVCGDDIDNDCSGDTDGADAIDADTWYPDLDGDGFGDPAFPVQACAAPAFHVAVAGDCDDTSAASFPGNPEVCDDRDNDCAAGVDDGLPLNTLSPDADKDGWGDPAGASFQSCFFSADGFVANSSDCNDADKTINPLVPEVCDGIDNNCVSGTDEGLTTRYYPDNDGDGYGNEAFVDACVDPGAPYVTLTGDCQDLQPAAFPNNPEICDGIDNDCANGADDGFPSATYYRDLDLDGHGDPDAALAACDGAPAGYVAINDDCDDAEPLAWTGNPEVCDGADNDCNGNVDGPDALDALTVWPDTDGDGRGDASKPALTCDPAPDTALNADDCDDTDILAWTGNPEVCDGSDNDCDGETDGADADDATTTFADRDEDGHGDPTAPTTDCVAPNGNVATNDDCDDDEPLAWTGNTEVCDGADNDCSGNADGADAEGAATWYADDDRDGFGDDLSPIVACDLPDGAVANDGDCDDGRNEINPDAESYPDNGVDEDCDGQDPVSPDEEKEAPNGCTCDTTSPATPPVSLAALAALLMLRRRQR